MTEWVISQPTLSHDAERGVWRLDYDVDGEQLYFESNVELVPAMEGVISAFLAHSLEFAAPLAPAGPVDRTYAENMGKAGDMLTAYWGHGGPRPVLQELVDKPVQSDKGGLFFTGGIDSFYTLRKNLSDISYLINVHGFDIKLDDPERHRASVAGIRNVADSLGLDLILVETNLKNLEKFRTLPWEKTFLTALMSVAHILQKHINRIYVAAGYQSGPAGSTPELDVLWSSAPLRVISTREPARLEKTAELVDWAPVKTFLAVCWQQFSDELNCGYCEKCLRTQLGIQLVGGDLREFTAFPATDLTVQIAKLSYISPAMYATWWDLHGQLTDQRLRRTISRTIYRSKAVYFRQKAVHRIKRLLGLI